MFCSALPYHTLKNKQARTVWPGLVAISLLVILKRIVDNHSRPGHFP